MGFALQYAAALGVVGLLLLGLHAAARLYARGRRAPKARRIVEVLETTPLTQHATLHVVKIDGRRYLLASGRTSLVAIVSPQTEES